MEILLSFLGGLLLTALVAFFVARSVVRSRVAQATEKERLQVESGYKVEVARLEAELNTAREKVQETREQAQKTREQAEKTHQEAMEALQGRFKETIDKVTAQVKLETGEMLKARQKEFSEASSESLGQIVDPLKERIAELKKAMEEGNKEQAERSGEMKERIRSLMELSDAARKSADDLSEALKHGSKLQGDWGETILEELLSSQGLTKGVHFDTQEYIRDAAGNIVEVPENRQTLRPDVILHLDERREVIIDSKVSLTAFVEYVNAERDEDRKQHLKAHVESIRRHVKELSHKDYSAYIQPPKESAGYVIMFVPNSGALWTALREEPTLWRWAAEMNVYIADEQSLYGALKMVSLTWKQVVQAQNHKKVFELADEMVRRVGMFAVQYEALGESLKRVSDVYGDGAKKLSPSGKSIVTTARQLIDLGADGKQLISVSSSKKKRLDQVLGLEEDLVQGVKEDLTPPPPAPDSPEE